MFAAMTGSAEFALVVALIVCGLAALMRVSAKAWDGALVAAGVGAIAFALLVT